MEVKGGEFMPSRDDLIKQLVDKGVVPICPFCNKDKWAVNEVLCATVPIGNNGNYQKRQGVK
jgi:hypothetical protein